MATKQRIFHVEPQCRLQFLEQDLEISVMNRVASSLNAMDYDHFVLTILGMLTPFTAWKVWVFLILKREEAQIGEKQSLHLSFFVRVHGSCYTVKSACLVTCLTSLSRGLGLPFPPTFIFLRLLLGRKNLLTLNKH